ncbi:MAG: anti-sigma factor family protein [Gemmatimonadales bacterium]
MTDHWTDRLSDYLDGYLEAAERAALEAHLPTCAACRTTLAELRRVVARARTLEEAPPETDLWPGIAARIGRGRAVRRRLVSFNVPQLLAASVALVLVGGAAAVALLRQPPAVTPAAPSAFAPDEALTVAGWRSYASAVAQLEAALAQNRSRLDTATVRVVEQSLATIDRAIADAQRALAADPANAYLNHHLAQTMRRKVELLRRANALTDAAS